jgi:hypothetical protein
MEEASKPKAVFEVAFTEFADGKRKVLPGAG